MKLSRCLVFLVVVAMFAVFMPVAPVFAGEGPPVPDEVWVSPDYDDTTEDWGLTHFDCIQEAIDAVKTGGTVNVGSGNYTIDATIVVGKKVTIIGPDDHSAILTGESASITQVIGIASHGVSIENLVVTLDASVDTPTDEMDRALIVIANPAVEVRVVMAYEDVELVNNKIYGPYSSDTEMGEMWTRGIVVNDGFSPHVVIEGNTIYNVRNGIVVRTGNSAHFKCNTIFNTKGGIMNYTNNDDDAANRVMEDNNWLSTDSLLPNHNEWDIVWNSGGGYAPTEGYEPVIALSEANNGAYVLDRRALSQDGLVGNRSHAFVDPESPYDAPHAARGNFNEPFSTLALGIEAVAEGGTVILVEGTYVEEALDPAMNLTGKTLTYSMAGQMTLLLPADILPTEAVVVTIERVTDETPPSGFRFLTDIYRFTIVGEDELPASFSGNMTMIFYFDPDEVDDPALLDVYWYDPDAEEWVALSGVVDMDVGTVTVEVDHWSDFALMETETYTVTFEEATGLEPTVEIALEADGERIAVVDGEVVLENGEYYFFAQLEGYEDYEGTFTVAGEDKTVEFTMVAVEEPAVEEPVEETPETGTGIMLLIPFGLLALAGGLLVRRKVLV